MFVHRKSHIIDVVEAFKSFMHAAVVVVFYIASLWLSLARCLIVKLELFGHELSLHL